MISVLGIPINFAGPQQRGKPAIGWSDTIFSEYPGPRFEDKFRSANQMDGISKAGGDKMAAI